MNDSEFWEHVLDTGATPDEELIESSFDVGECCPVCGEYNACMYDAEGRPLIHAEGLQSEARE